MQCLHEICKFLLKFTASITCAECISAVPIYTRFEKGRRQRTKKKDDQIPCAGHKGNITLSITLFLSFTFEAILLTVYISWIRQQCSSEWQGKGPLVRVSLSHFQCFIDICQSVMPTSFAVPYDIIT